MREAIQYKNIDLPITAECSGNPFDKKISCLVEKPTGDTFTVQAFYNGGNEYLARVYADTLGEYTYKIFDDATVYDSGVFTAIKSDNNHGKLRQSCSDKSKIEYSDGTPFYMLGFEVDWLFLLDDECEDFPKAKTLIDTIAKNGFNMAVTNIIANDVTWKDGIQGYNTQYDFSNPKQGPFTVKDGVIDHTYLDTSFFQRMDKIVEYLEEKGIALHLMIYVWNKFVLWPDIFSDDDNRFYDYVINRYQGYSNILWDVSKEALSYKNVTSEDIRKKAILLREQDVYGNLITVHDAGFCSNNPDVIDIYCVQNWEYNIHQGMLDIIKLGLDKIICNVEHGGYERGIFNGFHGAYNDPAVCLERNYICAFLGIYTVYYWQNASWNIVVWDTEELAPNVRPKYEYYKYFREYMEKICYENLTISTVAGKRKLALQDGEYYYIFKPSGMAHITLWKLDVPIGSSMEWFNPITNEYTTTVLSEFDRTYGLPSPWGEAMSAVRLKMP